MEPIYNVEKSCVTLTYTTQYNQKSSTKPKPPTANTILIAFTITIPSPTD
jgi:hypothetical protein